MDKLPEDVKQALMIGERKFLRSISEFSEILTALVGVTGSKIFKGWIEDILLKQIEDLQETCKAIPNISKEVEVQKVISDSSLRIQKEVLRNISLKIPAMFSKLGKENPAIFPMESFDGGNDIPFGVDENGLM
jgi:hypothetical protein